MHELLLALSGLAVGVTVGLTGMGGGALMTPLLMFGFGVPALPAVSTDLVTSLVMKPVGAAVHARHGTIHWPLVGWLCAGSVPAALVGVLVIHLLGNAPDLERGLQIGIGTALTLAIVSMLVKGRLAPRRAASGHDDTDPAPAPRPLVTLAIGISGGFVVGMTSVGSGSLILVLLLFAYPTLTARHLVGTDLAQAVPLVAAAAVGHLFLGTVSFTMAGALLLGAIPGIYFGARLAAKVPGVVVRQALMIVLSASALKLYGLPADFVAAALGVGLVTWACWTLRTSITAREVGQ